MASCRQKSGLQKATSGGATAMDFMGKISG